MNMAYLQLFQFNWNNKIIRLQDGILYTSSRLVGTSVEDSDVSIEFDLRLIKSSPVHLVQKEHIRTSY